MSGCTLRFTKYSPVRTTLIDEATGHAKYKIETPIKISRVITRIRKFESQTQTPLYQDDDIGSESDDDATLCGKMEDKLQFDEGSGEDFPESSDEMARIYWKLIAPDEIVFQGKTHIRSEFLPKCGKMKGSYTFTGPDGVQYRWAMGALGLHHPKLVTADEKKTLIAEFHGAHHLIDKQKARLEVQQEGVAMLDLIVLTFVYVERKRRQREGVENRQPG